MQITDKFDKGKYSITGMTLKIIAMLAMLIDHFAAVFMIRWLNHKKIEYMLHPEVLDIGYQIYDMLRIIGRISFPIFIFLLVEGVIHTRNKINYLLRMILLAFISEIPYDLAMNLHERQILQGKFIEFDNQNIFFTLSAGLMTVILIEWIQSKLLFVSIRWILCSIVILVGIRMVYYLHVDYMEFGYLAIVVMYLLHKNRILAVLTSGLVLVLIHPNQWPCLASIIPILFYNGKRGLNIKWLFYWFYPIHLFVLWAICFIMGIA